MSLFSIVQGVTPPLPPAPVDQTFPPMEPPQAAPAPAYPAYNLPQMNAPMPPPPAPTMPAAQYNIPGHWQGGYVPAYGWGDEVALGEGGANTGNGDLSNGANDAEYIQAVYGADADPAQAQALWASLGPAGQARKREEIDYFRNKALGGTAGSDNALGYAQLAQNALLDAQKRRDSHIENMQANRIAQEQATQDYRRNIVDADNTRKQIANSALSQSQDFFSKILGQADPNQGALWVRPGDNYETTMKTQGPTYAAPNIPGLDYGEGG